MKKSLKILSFVISIFIFVSFVGNNRVKAVSAGAVLGAGAIVACVGAIASLIANDSVNLAQSGSSIGGYSVDASGYRSSAIIDSYLSQYDISSIDDIDDINILIEITDPQKFIDYCGGLDSFTSDEYTAYYTISHIHYEAQNNKFFTDVSGLIFSPDTFSDIVNSVSSDVISEITGNEASVSFQNGIRNITIYRTSTFEIYSDLASQYSVRSVYRPRNISPPFDFNDSGNFFVLSNVAFGDTFYYVYVCGSCYVAPVSCTFDLVPDNYGNYYAICGPCSSMPFVYSHYQYSFSSSYHSKAFSDPVGIFYRFSIPDYFPTDALFEFSNLDDAQRFADALGTFTEDNYNPDDDVYSGDDVISGNLPFSDTEKKVDVYEQDHPGVDDIDIVVNPGAVKADDGTTTYNPSISVNDTPLDDIDVTGYLDLDDTLDRFQLPSSISTKFPFSLPFDIYNLFNVFSAEPVTPQFTVPLDMTSVGGEVYNIDIDLSDFDDVANIVRWLLYGLFLIGLIILTNKLIGRG